MNIDEFDRTLSYAREILRRDVEAEPRKELSSIDFIKCVASCCLMTYIMLMLVFSNESFHSGVYIFIFLIGLFGTMIYDEFMKKDHERWLERRSELLNKKELAMKFIELYRYLDE